MACITGEAALTSASELLNDVARREEIVLQIIIVRRDIHLLCHTFCPPSVSSAVIDGSEAFNTGSDS